MSVETVLTCHSRYFYMCFSVCGSFRTDGCYFAFPGNQRNLVKLQREGDYTSRKTAGCVVEVLCPVIPLLAELQLVLWKLWEVPAYPEEQGVIPAARHRATAVRCQRSCHLSPAEPPWVGLWALLACRNGSHCKPTSL